MAIDSSKLVEKGYDKIASSYHGERNRFNNQPILKRYAQYVPDKGHILDLGCGSGMPVSKFFLDRGCSVTGIDVSQAMLDLARKNLSGATLIKKSMRRLDFPDESFDGVVSFYALFHVPRSEHRAILKHTFRMLRPGGSIVFSVGSTAWEGVEDFHGIEMYWSHFAPSDYGNMLEDIGFELVYGEAVNDGTETHFWFIGRKCA